MLCIVAGTAITVVYHVRQNTHQQHARGLHQQNGVLQTVDRIGETDSLQDAFYPPLDPNSDDKLTQCNTPTLRLYKKETTAPVLLRDGDRVFEGDEVQLQYTAQQPFGVIFSVDGRGVVSLHFPNKAGESSRMATGTHLLPFAFKLDDAPGFEAFYIASSDKPISVDHMIRMGAAIRTEQDDLPATMSVNVNRVVLHKLLRE